MEAKYSAISQTVNSLQAEAEALPTGSLNEFTAALKTYSQKVSEEKIDIAGSLKELDSFAGYTELQKASVGDSDTDVAGSCERLQKV